VERVIPANNFVKQCLQNKMESGIPLDDQAIASCFMEYNKDGECVVDQKGNCVTDSSLEVKNTPKPVMTANEDEIKKQEEEKARKAEDEEEKKEEARKAEEHEKEEDEARKAQDDEKEKKVDEIAKLKAELHEVKEKMEDAKREAEAKPIVDKIVTAKLRLNLIKDSEQDKEFESLVTLPIDQLTSIASQYSNVKADTPYSVLTLGASTQTYDGDKLIMSLGSTD